MTDIPSGPYAESAAALVERAATEDTVLGRLLLETYATRLATGLASLVSVLDPELVVLSGASLTAAWRHPAHPRPGRAGGTGSLPAPAGRRRRP